MWTAHLFRTTTGIIGPQLQFESMSWSLDLNNTETIDIQLRKSELPKIDLYQSFSAWWSGIVLLWAGMPVVAGPIITRPTENEKLVSITCGGIRSILANRLVIQEESNWRNLNEAFIDIRGKSLGTIAQEVVKFAMAKPGGSLPISFPIPEELALDDEDHFRRYDGFNVANLSCDKVLTDLSNTTNGPDIMFKPRLIRDNQLTFDMWHGTESNPRIQQNYTQVWDTTPQDGKISEMSVIYTGTYQASRVFSTGAGQDKGILIAVHTNETPLQQGYPLLEKVINTSNSDNPDVVWAHGLANLQANEKALLEIQMTVRGDGNIPIGKFWPGDVAQVITKNWISLPDGMTPMRILAMSGNHTNSVKVSLQKA